MTANDELLPIMQETIKTQNSNLEALAQLYLKQHGIPKGQLVLIQQFDGDKIKWWLEEQPSRQSGHVRRLVEAAVLAEKQLDSHSGLFSTVAVLSLRDALQPFTQQKE